MGLIVTPLRRTPIALVQSFHGSPSLDHRSYGREHSQNKYRYRYPECPELLWASTISPQLSPADWGRLKDFLVKLEKPVSPMIEVQQGETSGNLEGPRFVEILLLVCEKKYRPGVPQREK